MLREPDVGKPGASAGRKPLADGVEIVQQLDTGPASWNAERDDLAVFVDSRATEPVSVESAGAVVFSAVQDIAVAVTADGGMHRSARAPRSFVDRASEEVALQQTLKQSLPTRQVRVGGCLVGRAEARP